MFLCHFSALFPPQFSQAVAADLALTSATSPNALVVTHGGLMRLMFELRPDALPAGAPEAALRSWAPNTGVTVAKVNGDGRWRLTGVLNCGAHIGRPGALEGMRRKMC